MKSKRELNSDGICGFLLETITNYIVRNQFNELPTEYRIAEQYVDGQEYYISLDALPCLLESFSISLVSTAYKTLTRESKKQEHVLGVTAQ